ncbi:MAG: type III pantothenate kinase [Actinomycetota bacterium]|nr:type III pantothenate kinase [Actinomycetota bacterium]MDQ5828455.1 type III pantothenate kinase [Actinomycetota bacterium]
MAADIGNTQTVLGLFEGEDLRGQWRIATEAHRTSDELAVVFAGLLALRGLRLEEVSALIASSVVPALARSYRDLAAEIFEVPFYPVDAQMETGLKNRYDDPGSVGADRIVNAVAAGGHYGFPAIIVDIGTATTVEAVNGDGCYLGGAILTGLYVSLDALVSRTAKLPSVDLEEGPPRVIATNTPDSIRSGFIYGYAGALDALIRRSREELGEDGIRVIATGGPAGVIVPHCREIEEFDPDLTLKGLRILYEMNK